MDPKQNTNAKVFNAFIKILISELSHKGTEDILKSDFMNEAMQVYTKRNNEVETLARTYQNLNQKEGFSKAIRSSRLSPRKSHMPTTNGNINGYSSIATSSGKAKDISSRFKMNTMSMKKKSIIPAGISNVNKNISQKYIKSTNHNDSLIPGKPKKPKNGRQNNKLGYGQSLNKSLQRYKLGCNLGISRESSAETHRYSHSRTGKLDPGIGNDSRNLYVNKSKSTADDESPVVKFNVKKTSQKYSKLGLVNQSVDQAYNNHPRMDSSLNKSPDKGNFSINQMLFEDMRHNKTVKKSSLAKKNIKTHRNTVEHLPKKPTRKNRSSNSVSSQDVYRAKDSKYLVTQQRPIFIANLLNGSSDDKVYDEVRAFDGKEEHKSYMEQPIESPLLAQKAPLGRSPSESNGKGVNYLGVNATPHGGALEKLNNEERLNFLSDANLSKIDNNSANRRAEKSVDLSMRTVSYICKLFSLTQINVKSYWLLLNIHL